ncbi:MAG: nucleotidyltransferase domain-containing protein [Caldilineaceae bacterium]
MTISAEKMELYRETARRRAARQKAELDARFGCAWRTARSAAQLLKENFSAKRVVVFGSLVNRKLFHTRSDIDLAVWGISENQYFAALSAILDVDPQFSVDLVRMEDIYGEESRIALVKTIEQEGREL